MSSITGSRAENRQWSIDRKLARRAILAGRATGTPLNPVPVPPKVLRDLGPPDAPTSSTTPAPAPAPPTRTGSATLTVSINGSAYALRKLPPPSRGATGWRLRKLDAPRAGACYSVLKTHGIVGCTCEDHTRTGSRCKHIAALTALGLVGRYRSKLANSSERGA